MICPFEHMEVHRRIARCAYQRSQFADVALTSAFKNEGRSMNRVQPFVRRAQFRFPPVSNFKRNVFLPIATDLTDWTKRKNCAKPIRRFRNQERQCSAGAVTT